MDFTQGQYPDDGYYRVRTIRSESPSGAETGEELEAAHDKSPQSPTVIPRSPDIQPSRISGALRRLPFTASQSGKDSSGSTSTTTLNALARGFSNAVNTPLARTGASNDRYRGSRSLFYSSPFGFRYHELSPLTHDHSLGDQDGKSPSGDSGGKDHESARSSTCTSGGQERGPPSLSSSGGRERRPPSLSSSGGRKRRPPSLSSSGGRERGPPPLSSSGGRERGPSSLSSSGDRERGPSSLSSSGGRERGPPPLSYSGGRERGPSSLSRSRTSGDLDWELLPPSSHSSGEGHDLSPLPHSKSSKSELLEILSEMKKSTSKLESIEHRLQKLEDDIPTTSASSSVRKRKVPTRVRVSFYFSLLLGQLQNGFLFILALGTRGIQDPN